QLGVFVDDFCRNGAGAVVMDGQADHADSAVRQGDRQARLAADHAERLDDLADVLDIENHANVADGRPEAGLRGRDDHAEPHALPVANLIGTRPLAPLLRIWRPAGIAIRPPEQVLVLAPELGAIRRNPLDAQAARAGVNGDGELGRQRLGWWDKIEIVD